MGAVRLAWSDDAEQWRSSNHSAASSEDHAAPIRIEYHADSACPSEQDFRKDVTARAAQAAPRYGHDARLFVVVMTGAGGQAHGHLQIFDSSGSAFVRDVMGESCNEVASALALVTALAIDPLSFTAPTSSSRAPVEAPGVLALANAVPYATARLDYSRRALTVPPLPRSRMSSVPSARVTRGGPVTWGWSTGIQGISMGHVVPKPAFGGGLFADLTPDGAWIIWPDFRLGAIYATTVNTWEGATGVGARWWWLLARAEACPLRLATADATLTIRTCGGFDAGIITANGKLKNADNTTGEWVAIGPSLRLAWQPPTRFAFELGTGLNFPLKHWSFTYKDSSVSDDITATSVKNWGWTLAGSIAYRWQ